MSFARSLHKGTLEKEVATLWQQFQQKPVRSFRHGFRYFRFVREFQILQPNPAEWKKTFPESREPDCEKCPDNCCKGIHNTVLLRLSDLALFVDKGWTDSITLEKPSFSEESLQQNAVLKEMLQSFHWKVFPVLKKKDNGTCVFLDPENKCSIHAFRPWICRRYPYSFDWNAKEIFWGHKCKTWKEPEESSSTPKELEHALFQNFFVEKTKDLVLLSIYKEEIQKLGLLEYLNIN